MADFLALREGSSSALSSGDDVGDGDGWRTSDKRAPGEEEDTVTMSAAMLLHGGGAADNARQAGGGRCYTGKGVDDNVKRRERASDDGAAV